MTITVKINTDNDVFQYGNKEAEVARILRGVAMAVERGERDHNLFDSNGNNVGSVKVTGK